MEITNKLLYIKLENLDVYIQLSSLEFPAQQ